MKHVVVIEEATDVTDASLNQLIKGLELSEAKAQRLLGRIPGVVTKAVERSEAELIAERFRWAGFRALTRPATETELANPEAPEATQTESARPESVSEIDGVETFGLAPPEAPSGNESEDFSANLPASQTSQATEQELEPPVSTRASEMQPDLDPGLKTSEPRTFEREEVAGSIPTTATEQEVTKFIQPSAIPEATKKSDLRIGADSDQSEVAEPDATADVFNRLEPAPQTLLDKRIAEQKAAETEFLPKDPFRTDAFAAEVSDETGFEKEFERPSSAKKTDADAGSSAQFEVAKPEPPQSHIPNSERPDPPPLGFQDTNVSEASDEPPSGTIVAEDFGLLRPRKESSLWLRRLVLALPAFLSVLVVVVYVRGSLVSGITEALRWAPAAVTDVLAVSLEEGAADTLPSALSDELRSHMNRLQPVLAAQGVELVLVTDARGTFIAGWSGAEPLFRTPSALVNSLPMVISNARSATEGRAPSLSIPANRLNASELPLILDSRSLDLGGTPAVLSVATPNDAATFVSQVSRRTLLAGLIPVLLTVIAAMAFIRKQD